MSKKVLFSMPYPPSVVSDLDQFLEQLQEHGLEPIVSETCGRRMTEDELIQAWTDVYAHICGADPMTERAISSSETLKIISRIGIGSDSVDIQAATKKGVAVCVTPGAGAEAVAEHTFAMILALSRRIVEQNNLVKGGNWGKKVVGYSLYGKTLGIIGLGNIGKRLILNAAGFDMRILAYDPYYQDESFAKKNNVIYCDLDTIYRESDYISVHLPLTDETRGMISANEMSVMKNSAQIINCARGGIIDEVALYHAVKNGSISGAALDVFAEEPVNMENPLLTLDRIIVSPHNAGTSVEGKNKVVGMAVQNVIDVYEGRCPRGLLNPEVMSLHH